MTPREPGARERILDIATSLFAALGYDATPIEVIAEATGYTVSEIVALVGDKQTLYRAVMDRVGAGRRVAFDVAIAEFTPDQAGLHALTDRILDYCVAHPELVALWMHRWQSDAADITELEKVYIRPEIERLHALLSRVAPAETDVELALHVIAWSIRGFCIGGIVNDRGMFQGPDDPVLLERFRRHMHHVADLFFLRTDQ